MSRTSASTRKSFRPLLGVEDLENRTVMAVSVSLSGGVVSILGDSWHNNAVINRSGSSLVVEVTSTPSSGFSLVPSVVRKTFTESSVSSFFYRGSSGNDRFVLNVAKPSTAYGEDGDDYLEGSNAVDTFYGGNGKDILKGFSGNDGLYGGAGDDELYGGSGADRFLQISGQSEVKDANSSDAVVTFRNDVKTWNASEIEKIDAGLALLHARTGNTKLLKTSTGANVTIYRGGDKGTTLADNNSVGRLNFYDRVFTSSDKTTLTVAHEMAHNWDNEHSKWTEWKAASSWRQSSATGFTKGTDKSESWWYKNGSTFSRDYGKTNPKEDFATAWESYFYFRAKLKTNSLSNVALNSAKQSHLDTFFGSMS